MKTVRTAIICFAVLLLVVKSGAQVIELKEWNLKGKVKSIIAQEWVVRDSLGKTIRKKKIIPFGLTNRITVFNQAGWAISSTELDSSAGKKAWFYTYDKNNQLTTITQHNRNNTKKITRYEYESKEDKVYTWQVDEKGERWKTEEKIMGDKGPLESIHYTAPDTIAFSIEYTYDNAGNLVGMTTQYPDQHLETWSWKWKDGNKQQGIKMVSRQGKKTGSTMYFYDGNNHVVRETESKYETKETRATLYEYTFDTQGNWITRKMFLINKGKKELFFFAERQMTYYE